MILLGANILVSYLVLVVVTIFLVNKIKSIAVYSLFWYILFSVPCAYCVLVFQSLLALLAIFSSALILLYILLRRTYRGSRAVIILIPLPQVLAILYMTLVFKP